MVLPWIFYQEILEAARDMGDNEFLSIKEFDGKILRATGNLAATGTIASIIPASGKTFYHSKSTIFSNTVSVSAEVNHRVELQNNGTTIDYLGGAMVTDAANGTGAGAPNPKSQSDEPDSLAGDGIKAFRLQLTAVLSATVFGKITGFIEDTGTSPEI